jgi:putative phage-type endonuclease
MEQRSSEWMAIRCGKLTGSRFADVMNLIAGGKPGANRRSLITMLAVERLTGKCVETFQNDAMRRGTELEPEARAAYEAFTGELVEEVGFIPHPTLKYVGVSPDGLLGDDGMVELKAPANMAKHLDALRANDHAKEYRWQLQGQLWVAHRKWVDAVSYDPRFPEHLRLAICRVPRDEAAIKELAAECAKANDEIEEVLFTLQQKAA